MISHVANVMSVVRGFTFYKMFQFVLTVFQLIPIAKNIYNILQHCIIAQIIPRWFVLGMGVSQKLVLFVYQGSVTAWVVIYYIY